MISSNNEKWKGLKRILAAVWQKIQTTVKHNMEEKPFQLTETICFNFSLGYDFVWHWYFEFQIDYCGY